MARGRVRMSKKAQRQAAKDEREAQLRNLERLEIEIERTNGLIKDSVDYLEAELARALKEPGNDTTVSRIHKGIEERNRSARREVAAIRRAQQAGLVAGAVDQPEDFASILGA